MRAHAPPLRGDKKPMIASPQIIGFYRVLYFKLSYIDNTEVF